MFTCCSHICLGLFQVWLGGGVEGWFCIQLFTFPHCISILASLPPVSAVTPLQSEQFAWELRRHPNRQLVQFVLEGIRHGFKLGFCHTQPLKPAKKNKPSAVQHAAVIDEYLANEVSRGRVAGPFNSPPLPNLQVSSFGVIPKRGNQGSGVLLWISRRPRGLALMMGSTQRNSPYTTLRWIR